VLSLFFSFFYFVLYLKLHEAHLRLADALKEKDQALIQLAMEKLEREKEVRSLQLDYGREQKSASAFEEQQKEKVEERLRRMEREMHERVEADAKGHAEEMAVLRERCEKQTREVLELTAECEKYRENEKRLDDRIQVEKMRVQEKEDEFEHLQNELSSFHSKVLGKDLKDISSSLKELPMRSEDPFAVLVSSALGVFSLYYFPLYQPF
jgi:chromosome segregation ATPase